MTRLSVVLCLVLAGLCLGSAAFGTEAIAKPLESGHTVRIAAIYAATGDAAPGTDMQDFHGAALAVEDINASGGLLGRPLELMAVDNASTPLKARQAAKQAIAAGVLAVVGGPFSGLSKAMAEVCQAAKTPFVASISTNPGVTRVGEYIYRVCYTDDQQGEILARFARTGLSAGTAAVLANVGSEYSIGLADVFAKEFTRTGGRVLTEQTFKTNDTDFSEQLAAVAAAAPDVVFVPGYALESGLIIRQAAAMGLTTTFLGGDGWGPVMAESGKEALNGHYYATHWHPDAPSRSGQSLEVAARAEKGTVLVQPDSILAYDAVMLLADAVRRAGSLDREAVNAALATTRDFQARTGSITFDAQRNPLGKEICILRFENGRAVFHTTFK